MPSSNAQLIADAISSCPANGEILVIAHTKAAADEFVRLTMDQGRIGAHALTLTQLAAIVAGPAMGEAGLAPLTRLASEAIAARIAYDAIRDNKLHYFGPVADMPGFARALANTLTELRLQRVTAAQLRRAGKPGADLACLLTAFDDQLEERRLADLADILALATREVELGTNRLIGLPLVLLDVPLDYRAQRDFVSALKQKSPAVFEGRVEPHQGPCSSTLHRVRRYLFSPEAPDPAPPDPDLIFSAPGEGLECVEIARRIRALAESGTPFDRVAVLLRDPLKYQPLMEDAMRRAGIPEYFSRGVARPDPAARAFLALLACALEGCTASRFAEYLSLGQVPRLDANGAPPRPARKFVVGDDELLTALPFAPETDAGAAEEEPTPDSAVVAGALSAPANWEKLLVDAAVVGGYDRWKRRLTGLEYELRQKLTELRREDDPVRAHIERQLAQLRNLERFALPLIEFLHALPDQAPWGVWLDRLTELAGMALRTPDSVLSLLAELQPMAQVGPVGLREVHGVLSDRLGALRRDPPRRRYGRVFIGAVEEARGRVFDAVFLPGLAEGVFPRRAFEDPLLLDVYREQVSRDLAQRHDRDTRERDLLRIAAAAAAKTLTVSYPRVNVDQGRPRVPSFYALEVLRAAEGRLPDLREFEKRAAAACAARLDWPAPANPSQAIDNAEYDLAWLRAANNASGSGRYLIEQSAALAASLRTRWKRWERKWADSDGIVGPDAATTAALARHRLRARSYSPSSLQQFAACPYKFLLYAVLGVRPREESVALEQMDPLTRGALFHSAQFEFLGEVKRRKLLPVPEGRLDDLLEISDAVLDRVAAEQAEKLAPAIPRVWENEIEDIRTDLRGWVRHLAAERDWVPDRFEYAFGLKDHTDHRDPTSTTQEAVILDGIRVRGSIDLVERRSNGDALRITDHKTGKRPENPPVYVGGGAYLQPVLYALAAEQLLKENVESSRLFFCTQRGDYADYRVPVNAEARLRISQVMSAIDQAVENGFLPAAPAKGACAICDYAPICGPYEEQRTARKPKDRLEPLTTIRGLP